MNSLRRATFSALRWALPIISLISSSSSLSSQTKPVLAPGAPGGHAQWMSAGKQAVGTSNTLESKVWFTLQGGTLTEVFYPTADMPNVQTLEFVVVNPSSRKVETEREDATHEIQVLNYHSLSFRQINSATSGVWKLTKTYTTDPSRNTVLIDVKFETKDKGLALYVYFNPSLNNSGMHDTAWTQGDGLVANEADKYSALLSSVGFDETTNGFYQVSDGLDQLKQNGRIVNSYTRAENGNVAQLAKIKRPAQFTLALGFGKTATESLTAARNALAKGFENCRREYDEGWRRVVRSFPKVDQKYQAQFNLAAMVLKAHEDKTFRGANIASLSAPWITGTAANEPHVGGYHLVWARDLYQVATAYMALGDNAAAERALNYLFTVQQKADGSFPQITWIDGRPLGDAIQMDEVSYPLILAYQLRRTDRETYQRHIKRTADYIVKNGPVTQQERWEEKAGYSPATIAAEIAGLVCAAWIAERNGDAASARTYLDTADEWARKVESWTATTNGKYGGGDYYLRLTRKGTPNAGERIELNNNAGVADEREIVDPSFLELVRLGIKSPHDSLVEKSIQVVDQLLRVQTPHGDAWYRYARDGYGEMDDGRPWNWDGKYTGKGHLWVLLTGERGQYEIARGDFAKARERLDTMLGFANDGLMLPEQVWDRPQGPRRDLKVGEGTGSATPLAWSMAQFIRLAVNLRAGKNLDTPDIVAARYVK
ncbi:MAG TPA: glycoside hydrolase family 15 protein [Pyrinomonadaceae bacterium]|nr:glycoside hydrolase family 15 protein [Pyrinomonadaceae bacterium]